MRTTLALVTALLFVSPARAGTIALEISHRAELSDGELRVPLTLKNAGDESAHAVTPTLRFRGAEARGATAAVLPPGQPYEVSLALPAAGLAEGHWPYEIAVDYADANLYPFQALSLAVLTVGSPPLAKVAILPVESPALAGQAKLDVTVKNVSATPQRLSLRVLAPDAIEAGVPGGELVLEPWQELEVPVQLTNRAALVGSRYPIFLAVEYEDGPVHQAVVAHTTVEVGPEAGPLGAGSRPLWIGAALLVVAIAALVGFRLRRR
jgi:hypothetical protein